MPYEDVFIQELDRATSRLETTRINPTREFLKVDLGPDGKWTGSPALYTWQNGHWYDTGRNEIPEDHVPQKFRDEIAANPVQVTFAGGPEVTATCDICKVTMNQSEMNGHLLEHYRTVMHQAGSSVPPPVTKGEPPLTAKNTRS
jgi:hypothetical protein